MSRSQLRARHHSSGELRLASAPLGMALSDAMQGPANSPCHIIDEAHPSNEGARSCSVATCSLGLDRGVDSTWVHACVSGGDVGWIRAMVDTARLFVAAKPVVGEVVSNRTRIALSAGDDH